MQFGQNPKSDSSRQVIGFYLTINQKPVIIVVYIPCSASLGEDWRLGFLESGSVSSVGKECVIKTATKVGTIADSKKGKGLNGA
ncbi:MAG: hypothetical protein DRP66_03905 [Planctomycetota bacterium]|nr:MAG: hypothetical protein DRP66_03905 [Planctomycetota bacterium]